MVLLFYLFVVTGPFTTMAGRAMDGTSGSVPATGLDFSRFVGFSVDRDCAPSPISGCELGECYHR